MSTPELSRPLRVPLPLGLSPFALAFAAVVVAAGWVAARSQLPLLAFNGAAFANIGQVVAPLVVVSAFVERAVEVILTPLRGDHSERLQAAVHAARASAPEPSSLRELERRLLEHKLATRHIAFLLATGLGLVAAICGIRGLSALLSEPRTATTAFSTLDVLLTGVVVGGGADGIHQIVSAVTDYMNMISKTSQETALRTGTAPRG